MIQYSRRSRHARLVQRTKYQKLGDMSNDEEDEMFPSSKKLHSYLDCLTTAKYGPHIAVLTPVIHSMHTPLSNATVSLHRVSVSHKDLGNNPLKKASCGHPLPSTHELTRANSRSFRHVGSCSSCSSISFKSFQSRPSSPPVNLS